MKKIWSTILMSLSLAMPCHAELPQSWEFFTTSPSQYRGSLDTELFYKGRASGALVSQGRLTVKRHAVLLQKISAHDYRSRRIRISGFLTTKKVTGRAGIWVRVDAKDGECLAFENMAKQPIRGDTPWAKVTIEIDVPAEADEIHFGLLLTGGGYANLDDLEFGTVGASQPSRSVRRFIRALPTQPVNLEFER